VGGTERWRSGGHGHPGYGRAEHDAALTRTSVYVKTQYVMHLAQSRPLAVWILLQRRDRVGKWKPLGERKDSTGFGHPIRHSWPNWMGKC